MRDGYTSGERKRIYDLISELASHASYPGISLTTTGPDRMAQVGPFFDEKKLTVWLFEMAMRLSQAALVLSSDPEGRDLGFWQPECTTSNCSTHGGRSIEG